MVYKFREGKRSLNDEAGRSGVSNFDQRALQVLVCIIPKIFSKTLQSHQTCATKTTCTYLISLVRV